MTGDDFWSRKLLKRMPKRCPMQIKSEVYFPIPTSTVTCKKSEESNGWSKCSKGRLYYVHPHQNAAPSASAIAHTCFRRNLLDILMHVATRSLLKQWIVGARLSKQWQSWVELKVWMTKFYFVYAASAQAIAAVVLTSFSTAADDLIVLFIVLECNGFLGGRQLQHGLSCTASASPALLLLRMGRRGGRLWEWTGRLRLLWLGRSAIDDLLGNDGGEELLWAAPSDQRHDSCSRQSRSGHWCFDALWFFRSGPSTVT